MADDRWRSRTLDECTTFGSGGTPSKSRSDFWTGTIPWVSAKDLKVFRLYDAQDHVTAEAIAVGSRIAPAGAILLLVRGMTLHHDVPICVAMRDMAYNQDIKALVPKSGIDAQFLTYWLLSQKSALLSTVDSAGHGTGRLNTDTLRAMTVLLPPLTEQRAIAAILGALDDKIELNRRMNATLESMARALFQSWFVDFDPVRAKLDGRQPAGMDAATAGLFPDAFQDSELGQIPRGWSVQPVGEVVGCVGGGTPSTSEPKYWEGGTHHWTTPKDFSSLQSPILLDTERKLTDAGISKISSGLLPAGTLLLSSRAPVGYLAIVAMPVAINQGFIAMKCNERASNFFMLNWCQTSMAEIESRATGTTFAEISKQNFRPITVVLPPKGLMVAFTANVAPLYAQVTANLRESRTLATLRDTLLPKLLSGELTVAAATRLTEHA